jgi:hypothetical protein
MSDPMPSSDSNTNDNFGPHLYEGEEDTIEQYQLDDETKRRLRKMVAPPNTPFNSMSTKQATDMMSSITMTGEESSKLDVNNPSRPPLHRNKSSVKSIFEQQEKTVIGSEGPTSFTEKQVQCRKGTSIDCSELTIGNDKENHSPQDGNSSGPRLTSHGTSIESSKDHKGTDGTINIQDEEEAEIDVIRQSKLQEIKWQLRNPQFSQRGEGEGYD